MKTRNTRKTKATALSLLLALLVLLALLILAACTPQTDDIDRGPVALMPTATLTGAATATRATTPARTITLTGGTLALTMNGVPKDYTLATDGTLTSTGGTASGHIANVGTSYPFSVPEATVTATIAASTTTPAPGTTTPATLPMRLKVKMAETPLAVGANGTVALTLTPTTAALRLMLQTDPAAGITIAAVNSLLSGEKTTFAAPAPAPVEVAFGMLPAPTTIAKGTPLALIDIITTTTPGGTTTPSTLALLAPAPLTTDPRTLTAGQMLTYTVHVGRTMATITSTTIDPFIPGNGTGDDIGMGDMDTPTADGMTPLDLSVFNADNPAWIITGGGANATTDDKAKILTNVNTALTALNSNADARIHLLLPAFSGEITGSAFYGCKALAFIDAPEATGSIGKEAFKGCSNLTTISLPKVTGSIGSQAFRNCANLTTISLPGVTDNIGKEAFAGCSNLTTISLPGATSIVDQAFWGCSNLTTISLPKVTYIAGEVIRGCSALTRLELTTAEKLTVANNIFDFYDNAANLTLVLHSQAVLSTVGITVTNEGDKKKVTFTNIFITVGNSRGSITVKSVEYLNP